VIVIGYEHDPPKINLTPLIRAFEVVATEVIDLRLSRRVESVRGPLAHPVHQRARLCAWEVLGGGPRTAEAFR
jgi:hypothetical protein